MSTISKWLDEVGLGEYHDLFVEHKIDLDVLPELSEQDLKDLNIPLGHRKKFLKAISARDHARQLNATPSAAVNSNFKTVGTAVAERRQLTVMFVDLVGSTALSGRLDPEDLRELMSDYQNVAAGEITRFEGHIAQFLGDGVLAFFGWPRAHEDDAERAVRAGMALTTAVAKLRAPGGEPLRTRTGVATGLVVVGELIGEGVSREGSVVGETPNLAARLQGLAQPGTLVISDGTRRLLGDLFELRTLAPQRVKGIIEPVAAYVVVGESKVTSRFEAYHGGDALPLIGREEELALLTRGWRQATQFEGHMIVLSGEAGIGKSRILHALVDSLKGESHHRIDYHCSPYYTDSALYPAIHYLTRTADFSKDDGTNAKLQKLEAVLGNGSDRQFEHLRLIATLLGINCVERYGELEMSPQQQRDATFRALVSKIVDQSKHQSTLFVIEDAQWIDPTTLALIELTLSAVRESRVLIVMTARPTFEHQFSPGLKVTHIVLNRIGRKSSLDIINCLSRGKRLPETLINEIINRTDGVPLFVEEITKTVLTSGLLRETDKAYELDGPLRSLDIPSSLHDSLMARLDRLSPVRDVAQIGAAIGRQFDYQLLAQVSRFEEPVLQDALRRLVEAEIVFCDGEAPNSTYTFKHALVQETAYASMLRSKRRSLHTTIAEVLENVFSERVSSLPETLAHHCAYGELPEKAALYWAKAGRAALASSAAAESLAQVNKGLDALANIPPGPERDVLELELQTVGGWASIANFGYTAKQTGDSFRRARELCDRRANAPQRFPVLFGQWSYHLLQAEIGLANEIAGEMLHTAEQGGDAVALVAAHRVLGTSSFWLGRFELAHEHLEEALDLYKPEHRRQFNVVNMFDTRIVGLDFMSLTLLPLGFPAQALALSKQTLTEAEQGSELVTMAIVLQHGCLFSQLAGFSEATAQQANALITLAREQGYPFWLAHGELFRDWSECVKSPDEQRVNNLQQALQRVEATHSRLFQPYYSGLLAQAYGMVGRVADACEALDAAMIRIEATDERWFEPEVYRLRGTLVSDQSSPDQSDPDKSEDAHSQAITLYQHAMDIARKQKAKLWELRAATSLAEHHIKHGDRPAARDVLVPICTWFSEGFEFPDLAHANMLLKRLT